MGKGGGQEPTFRAGFVSLLGRPNVGKSTLLNRLMGEKLAPVSPRPQTTWGNIKGIYNGEGVQIAFVDTPGLHDPRDGLGRYMVRSALASLEDADLAYWMVEPAPPCEREGGISRRIEEAGVPTLVLINKIDTIPKESLLPVMQAYTRLLPKGETIPISALHGEGIEALLERTVELLPESPLLFPADILTDQYERFVVRDFIREKVFRLTQEEIPYSSAVKIEEMKEREKGPLYVKATIFVERESQKAILVGKKGAMVKRIGQTARREIENFLDCRVYLELRIGVRKKWRKDPASLREFGYPL